MIRRELATLERLFLLRKNVEIVEIVEANLQRTNEQKESAGYDLYPAPKETRDLETQVPDRLA
jgi:hypothetical protein